MLRRLAEVFPADGLVARAPLPAAERAALVAEEFRLVLERLRQRTEVVKGLVQAEIRHDGRKIRPFQLLPELAEVCQDLGGRGDEAQLRVIGFQVVQQQVRVDDDAVLRAIAPGKRTAEGVAAAIRKVLRAEQRVAERQAGRQAIGPRQGQNLLRRPFAGADAAAAPDAVRRRAVERADGAPVVKIFPVLKKQRQEDTVERIRLKQAGKMKICNRFAHPILPFRRAAIADVFSFILHHLCGDCNLILYRRGLRFCAEPGLLQFLNNSGRITTEFCKTPPERRTSIAMVKNGPNRRRQLI